MKSWKNMQLLPDTEAGLAYALEILKLGGVVAHATETCYGLACDLTNQKAVEKLFKIKKRPADQPVSALFPSIEATKEWVVWNKEAKKFAEENLPGPLTIILPVRKSKLDTIFPVPNIRIFEYSNVVGVRVSPHPVAMKLAEEFSKPLSTTSANIHGEPNPYSAEEIQKQFLSAAVTRESRLRKLQPDLILDSGELEKSTPSKVISLIDGKMKVLRD